MPNLENLPGPVWNLVMRVTARALPWALRNPHKPVQGFVRAVWRAL